tara:strand:+ start:15815 stop:16666 length:852 start_codon:yes stop_codon:yes gene_type:complete
MKNVWILGGTGMLGHAVLNQFVNSDGYKLYVTYHPRSSETVKSNEGFYKNVSMLSFDPLKTHLASLFNEENKPDYIINCIGIIKPYINDNLFNTVFINTTLPHVLSTAAKEFNYKLIHITTDCVFDGSKGRYTEDDLHTELDLYGRSKSLGEPNDCLVLRTSIIGPEIHKNASLISWAQSQKDQEVNGYINHIWNGITTKEYGRLCKKIIEENLYRIGKYHVFSPGDPFQKITLLNMISDKYNLNLKISPHEAPISCDRSLNSVHDFHEILNIKSFPQQLEEL